MSAESRTLHLGPIELNLSYMIIWGVLLLLTVIEVLIPEMSVAPTGKKDLFGLSPNFAFPRSISVLLLVMLAVVKTGCVGWFYMHLVDERPLVVLVGCAPFIFSIFLTIGLFPW